LNVLQHGELLLEMPEVEFWTTFDVYLLDESPIVVDPPSLPLLLPPCSLRPLLTAGMGRGRGIGSARGRAGVLATNAGACMHACMRTGRSQPAPHLMETRGARLAGSTGRGRRMSQGEGAPKGSGTERQVGMPALSRLPRKEACARDDMSQGPP
jgi:hypothetical protein